VSCAKTAEPIEIPFGVWTRVGWQMHVVDRRCLLASSGDYNWTVHVSRRCGLFVKLLWPHFKIEIVDQTHIAYTKAILLETPLRMSHTNG